MLGASELGTGHPDMGKTVEPPHSLDKMAHKGSRCKPWQELPTSSPEGEEILSLVTSLEVPEP